MKSGNNSTPIKIRASLQPESGWFGEKAISVASCWGRQFEPIFRGDMAVSLFVLGSYS